MVETLEKSNWWMLTPGTIGSRSQRILSGLWHLLSPQYLGSAQLYFQAGFSQDGVEKPSPQSSISERETLSQYLIHLPGALMLRPPVSSPQWCEEVAPGIQGMRRADFQREELTFSGKMNVYVCLSAWPGENTQPRNILIWCLSVCSGGPPHCHVEVLTHCMLAFPTVRMPFLAFRLRSFPQIKVLPQSPNS